MKAVRTLLHSCSARFVELRRLRYRDQPNGRAACGRLGDRRTIRSCVVDREVQTTEVLEGVGHEVAYLVLVSQVVFEEFGFRTSLKQFALQGLRYAPTR